MTTAAQVSALFTDFTVKAQEYLNKKAGEREYNFPVKLLSSHNPFDVFADELGLSEDYKGYFTKQELFRSHYRGMELAKNGAFYFPCYMAFAVGTQYVEPPHFLAFVVAASFVLRYNDRVVCCSVSSADDKNFSQWVKFANEYEGAVVTEFTRETGVRCAHLFFPVLKSANIKVTQGKHPS